ncbi:acyl-CoA dehydrogenase [Subtercola lobariae]|uniref:Acyl-CoA dehydrogenase n=1 Tax=Subtercola lobariae TaxID=1588641 RepID=A0A917BAR4_9MICO|nr:acyl-CoA dehydrogenase [Subtercola lobariae]GGF33152.1 acyl-CoA dehydrogenase [Subtercola lobariae]
MQHTTHYVSFEPAPLLSQAASRPFADGVMDALRPLLENPRPTVADSLAAALRLGALGIRPGIGQTQQLWQTLATIAAHDLGAARAVEPYLDALSILAEAAEHDAGGNSTAVAAPTDDRTWGVFAAEAPGGEPPLGARLVTTDRHGSGAVLSGTKPWCSLADRLSAALVTATLPSGERQLFAVDLTYSGVRVEPGAWFARGLAEIPSGPVHFDAVPATPVGEPRWYFERPGFSWGGIGVAACWYGGAVGVARAVFAAAAHPTTPTPTATPAPAADPNGAPATTPTAAAPVPGAPPNPFLLMHLGAIDALLSDSRRALREAAALVDAGAATSDDGRLLALRVRATVARASEAVLAHAAHALGPAPLAQNEAHAKRVADFELYLRQHHAEKDDAELGAQLAARREQPW